MDQASHLLFEATYLEDSSQLPDFLQDATNSILDPIDKTASVGEALPILEVRIKGVIERLIKQQYEKLDKYKEMVGFIQTEHDNFRTEIQELKEENEQLNNVSLNLLSQVGKLKKFLGESETMITLLRQDISKLKCDNYNLTCTLQNIVNDDIGNAFGHCQNVEHDNNWKSKSASKPKKINSATKRFITNEFNLINKKNGGLNSDTMNGESKQFDYSFLKSVRSLDDIFGLEGVNDQKKNTLNLQDQTPFGTETKVLSASILEDKENVNQFIHDDTTTDQTRSPMDMDSSLKSSNDQKELALTTKVLNQIVLEDKENRKGGQTKDIIKNTIYIKELKLVSQGTQTDFVSEPLPKFRVGNIQFDRHEVSTNAASKASHYMIIAMFVMTLMRHFLRNGKFLKVALIALRKLLLI